jgi:VCBS repeat-containing protein
VVGNPAAGIQEVWVTYTGLSGSYAGAWDSVDLVRNTQDSTLWEGSLALNGSAPGDIRYVLQAVNGVGLVSMDSNQGAYYIAGAQPSAGQASQLEFVPPRGSLSVPGSGRYSEQVNLSALLSSNGMPLASRSVAFTLGPQTRLATTDSNGIATVSLSIFGMPGDEQISASFGGDGEFQAAYTTNPFTVYRQNTKITLEASSVSGYPEDEGLLIATLSDDDGIPGTEDRRLTEETLFFILNGNGQTYYEAAITDYAGRAALGPLPLPPGEYNVDVYFSGNIPLVEPLTLVDERYLPAVYLNASLILLNRPPVALEDAYATDEDTPVSVAAPGVLTNDTDPEGGALTAILLNGPTHGQLDFSANGEFSYTPDQDFNGDDFFTYQASDGMDDSNIAEVSITVSPVNDAPVAEADSYITDEDAPLVIQAPGVLGNDTDVDGDRLSAILVTQPMFGTLTLDQEGSFIYTPDADFNGGDSFTYQASDGQLASEPVQVSLTIDAVNDAPVCDLATPSETEIWSPNKDFVTVTVENVSDPDGDPFSLNITSVFQDEPVVKDPDAINLIGNSVSLRADRDGNGDGRFYHVFFTATDIYGASCSGQVVVGVVQHDQSGRTSIDGGPLYDSTQPE